MFDVVIVVGEGIGRGNRVQRDKRVDRGRLTQREIGRLRDGVERG